MIGKVLLAALFFLRIPPLMAMTVKQVSCTTSGALYHLLLYPAMLWCALGYGITLGWVLLQSTANATYFPPLYNFSALAVGNTNIAVSRSHDG